MLKWCQYASYVRSKLASINYALARLKRTIPNAIKLQMYNSLFKCHLEYCLPIRGDCPGSHRRSIISLQKKPLEIYHYRNITLILTPSLKN